MVSWCNRCVAEWHCQARLNARIHNGDSMRPHTRAIQCLVNSLIHGRGLARDNLAEWRGSMPHAIPNNEIADSAHYRIENIRINAWSMAARLSKTHCPEQLSTEWNTDCPRQLNPDPPSRGSTLSTIGAHKLLKRSLDPSDLANGNTNQVEKRHEHTPLRIQGTRLLVKQFLFPCCSVVAGCVACKKWPLTRGFTL